MFVTRACFNAVVRSDYHEQEAFRRLLTAFAERPALGVTHADFDDRARAPFDADALVARVRDVYSTALSLRGVNAPRMSGYVTVCPSPLANVQFEYTPRHERDAVAVSDALSELVSVLRPIYAGLHWAWKSAPPEADVTWAGMPVSYAQFARCGPPGIYTRTWFESALVEQIGAATLGRAGATPEDWGGVRVTTVETPWAVPFEAFLRRWQELSAHLRSSEVFGSYDDFLFPKPGRRWHPQALSGRS